ncbi:MAG: hypothetical protein QOI63_1138 [Thermoplasmata archaeon]|jgi:hypothetical protein|nr:hypothetical protein [Thermoplasmata archaeon]
MTFHRSRPVLLALCAALVVLALPSAAASQIVSTGGPAGGPRLCVGFTVAGQSFHAYVGNPTGATGYIPSPDDPFSGPGWYAFVETGPGGC